MVSISFVSAANVKSGLNKNSRANKKKKFYKWRLDRFIQSNNNTDLEADVFPNNPSNNGIQLFKEAIIERLDQSSTFDFVLEPNERDFLSIENEKDSNDYLNLIYLHGKWCEEHFLFAIRPITDEYSTIKFGECEYDE